ncbi:hypothetical protein ACO0K2_01950 [Undibacterium sp. MH2W]|uniref:hypothetical protein n=1 Tax=Undibacterium sp. MH2W TaxID=3413044 RepID=UPI003BF3BF85
MKKIILLFALLFILDASAEGLSSAPLITSNSGERYDHTARPTIVSASPNVEIRSTDSLSSEKRELKQQISLFDFLTEIQKKDLVTGHPSIDFTPQIQAAINAAAGKTLFVPAGSYLLKAQKGNTLLTIANTISIKGQRGSQFLIDANVPNDVDVITVNPHTIADEGVEIDNLWIFEQAGKPARNIIKVNLDSEHGLKKLSITNSLFRAKSGFGIWVANPNKASSRGLFLSKIVGNEIYGGIQLDNLGDSNLIADNAITGPNIGIHFDLLNEVGALGSAAKLQIIRNNITSFGGAIVGSHARGIVIEDNNIEQTVPLQDGYSVALSYLDEVESGNPVAMSGVSVISRNKIEPADPTSRSNGLLLFKCNGTVVENNSIGTSQNGTKGASAITIRSSFKTVIRGNYLLPSLGGTGINIDSASLNTEFTRGVFSPVVPNVIEIKDQGLGTKGVWKSGVLASNWVPTSPKMVGFSFYKTRDNLVLLRGNLRKLKKVPNDGVIGFLPAGFLPEELTAKNGDVGEMFLSTIVIRTNGQPSPAVLRITRDTASGLGKIMLHTPNLDDLDTLSFDGITFYSLDIPT